MKKINIFVFAFFLYFNFSYADTHQNFEDWKKNFKKEALSYDISEETFNTVMSNVKFLPKVIEYDRFQPEFYEDTKTYVSKRSSKKKVKKGLDFYQKNFKLINNVEKKYKIEKDLLLALMGIETN